MTRFACITDLHIGAGAGYGPGRLDEQEAVWSRALELAAEHEVDAVLFAGDAFDRRRPTPAELMAFARPLREHQRALDVIAIPGNHDVEGDRPCGLELFATTPQFSLHTLLELHREPTVVDVVDVTVCCLPWVSVGRLAAMHGRSERDDLNEWAANLLVDTAARLRERVEPGRRAVLMLHFSISGASTPTGLPTDTFREPVLSRHELAGLDFDAIFAGHIHKPQHLFSPTGQPFFYGGSPMPLNFGEADCEHGMWIFDLPSGGAIPPATFVPIESRRFVTVDADLTADDGVQPEWLCDSAWIGYRDVRDAVVRVRYRCTEQQAREIDPRAVRAALENAGAHHVWMVKPEITRATRARVAELDEQVDDRQALDLWLAALQIEDATAAPVRARHDRYLEALA